MADRSDGGDSGVVPDGGEDAGAIVDAGPSYSVSGHVAHLDGTPWSSALVGLCSSVACLNPIRSTEAGTFEEGDLAPDAYVVDATGDNSDGGSASPVYFHFQLQSNVALTSPIVVPETGTGVVLTGGIQTVHLDSSLSLTVDPSVLTWPDGVVSPLSGIKLPSADWPASYASDLRDGGGNATILAIWALNPFQAMSSSPIAIVINNSFGLSPGSRAQLFGIDVSTGMPQDAIEMDVTADGGVLTTLPGQGITELTWLVLAAEN